MASTGFDFDFRKLHPYKELKLEGDTHYTNQCLRFTKTDDHDNPLQSSMGRGIYYQPVAFGANFKTEVQFKVTPMENTMYADGLAFFIVPQGYKFPTTRGGNVGIFGRPGVFAVVFDIYSQSQTPGYITLGIYISDKSTPKNSVPVPADSFLGTDLKLEVSYNSAIKLISASVSNGNLTFPVSLPYDLSDFLPPKVEVGLGSSTSELVAVHDAFSWGFKFDAPPAKS